MKYATCFCVGQNMAGYLPDNPEDNQYFRFKTHAIEALRDMKAEWLETVKETTSDGKEIYFSRKDFSGRAEDGEIWIDYSEHADWVLWWQEVEMPLQDYLDTFDGQKPPKSKVRTE